MRNPKAFIMTLALVLFTATLAPKAVAQGPERGTPAEERDYSQREAECGTLEKFSGGSAAGILLVLLIILAVVVIVYYVVIIDKEHHHSRVPGPHEPGNCPVARLTAQPTPVR